VHRGTKVPIPESCEEAIMINGTRRNVHVSATAIVFAVLFLDCSAFADLKGSHAIELFTQERYKDAQKAFENDPNGTWQNPDAACYYAATLFELGKTADAVKVCERVVRQYPDTEAANLARSYIVSWTGKSALEPDRDIGILGLGFTVTYGRPAEVKKVFPDTPAERSHLQARDLIMAVDGVPTRKLTKIEIADVLIGRPDTRVTLTIKRGSTTLRKVLMRMHSKEFARSHPDLWKKYLEPTTGTSASESNCDIGIVGFQFTAPYGWPDKVREVFPDTPAARSQLQAQDVILTIDGKPASSYEEGHAADELVRARPGTKVTLTVKRGSATLTKVLTRMHSKDFARSHPDLWKRYSHPTPPWGNWCI
jgi:predicted metalloprotease with PDZ domain